MKDEELRGLFEEMRKENVEAHAETRGYVERRFEAIEQRFDGMDQRLDGMDQRFEAIDHRFDGVREASEVAHEQTRRHFDVMVEKMDDHVAAVAESVTVLEERMIREIRHLRDVFQTVAETQAMMTVAQTNLERRVSALERVNK
jgi:archaellum component FlaC